MINRAYRVGFGIFLSGLMLGLGACSSKDESILRDRLQEHHLEFSMLQQSEKVIFRRNDGQSVILLLSYLPLRSKSSEVFILSTYPNMRAFSLRLASNPPLKIEQISRDELPKALREHTPSWFKSYRIIFPKSETKSMQLYIKDATSGELRKVLFAKEAKYLLHPTKK